MYLVTFISESCDDYYAIFKDEPTKSQLKRYMAYHFEGDIEDNVCYVRIRNIVEFKNFDIIPDIEALEEEGIIFEDIEWL
jgi:hypothetical protein